SRLRHFVLLASGCSIGRGPSLIWLPSADRSSCLRFPSLYTTDTSQTLPSPSQSIFAKLLSGSFFSDVLAAARSPWSSGFSALSGPFAGATVSPVGGCVGCSGCCCESSEPAQPARSKPITAAMPISPLHRLIRLWWHADSGRALCKHSASRAESDSPAS